MIRLIFVVILLVMASIPYVLAVEPYYTKDLSSPSVCSNGAVYWPSSPNLVGSANQVCAGIVPIIQAYQSCKPSNQRDSSFSVHSAGSFGCKLSYMSYYGSSNTWTYSMTGPLCSSGYHLSGSFCVSDYPTCTSLGVDVNAFIPKCSQMLSGSPSICTNSDGGHFSIAGCPSIQCQDGTSVIYPALCPVTSCSVGFTLSDLGQGFGQSCVKNLPDDENQKPCIYVQGNSQPLCADPQKNCQSVNGSFVCIKEETTPPPGSTCYTVNQKLYCLSNQPEVKTTKQSVTNPDGSTTTTETRTTNVQGDKPNVTTTTTQPDGSVITKGNKPSDVNKQLEYNNYGKNNQQQNQNQNLDLSTLETNTGNTALNTKSLFDKFTEFATIPTDASGYDQSAISFSNLDAALQADKDGFQSFVNQDNPMRAYFDAHPFSAVFQSLLPSYTGCAGAIHKTIFGKSFDFEPCNRLAPLREILAWFFSVFTTWQVLNIVSKSIVRF